MNASKDPAKDQLLDAILPHVAFDGWSQTAFTVAIAELGMNEAQAKTLCPRGAVDLAIAYHQRGDMAMKLALQDADMTQLRFRDKVARAICLRIEAIEDKEAVRRGTALLALPHMTSDGAKLVWGTADAIWTSLGDTSQDINWYTKRITLSGVYASTILFWLGDDSLDAQATKAFINRRIDDVMQFEKFKAHVKSNPALKPFFGPLARIMSGISAPARMPDIDLPGIWRNQP